MSTSDGSVQGVTKIVDHGPDASRWNFVILGDGYQSAELTTYSTDAQNFADTLSTTAPFDKLWPGINVHRVDVASTDSGAADPVACGGTGAAPHTYFDATFCGDGKIQRLLTVNTTTATSVASTQVPAVNMTFVIVNSSVYGGSGGPVAAFSKAAAAQEIGLHEMGHTAFSFADEYEYYAGCASGETGHDSYTGAEPAEPNATTVTDRTSIKWASLIATATVLPTTSNANCAQCDTQDSPVPTGTVGAFEGARYFHCGMYRPEYSCRMRVLGNPFCGVCSSVITAKITPYLPALAVTAINPATGDPAGGTTVTITGSGFTGATDVGFGPTSAAALNVDADTQITATSPAGTGTVDVTVTTPAGTSPTTTDDQFTYM
jgi:IgA Peptidase M64/IPT/TIG domain